MIRFINCVRKRQDISMDEFRRFWNSPEFDQMFGRLFLIIKPKGFAKNLTLQVSANQDIQEARGSSDPFDATIEYWWDNATELMENWDTEDAIKFHDEMLEFQKQFIDVENCHAFFTEYEPKMMS